MCITFYTDISILSVFSTITSKSINGKYNNRRYSLRKNSEFYDNAVFVEGFKLINIFSLLQGPTMLAFTLYTLTHTYNIEARFKLLQSLPTFCTDSLSTELVLGTLLKLTKQPHLLPMTLRLIVKCWERHDKLFPYLRSFLTPPSSAPLRDEWAISAAATLKDICCLRSEQHGEECLPYISQLLSYSEHPIVINLLITALTNLSLKGIADPALLWKLLSPKLSPGIK